MKIVKLGSIPLDLEPQQLEEYLENLQAYTEDHISLSPGLASVTRLLPQPIADQMIADMGWEYSQVMDAGQTWKARWIRIRCWWALGATLMTLEWYRIVDPITGLFKSTDD